jgi:hypothetical protein
MTWDGMKVVVMRMYPLKLLDHHARAMPLTLL